MVFGLEGLALNGKTIFRASRNYVVSSSEEKDFLNRYMDVKGSYDSSCETCNNCGSGDCASCCETSDD